MKKKRLFSLCLIVCLMLTGCGGQGAVLPVSPSTQSAVSAADSASEIDLSAYHTCLCFRGDESVDYYVALSAEQQARLTKLLRQDEWERFTEDLGIGFMGAPTFYAGDSYPQDFFFVGQYQDRSVIVFKSADGTEITCFSGPAAVYTDACALEAELTLPPRPGDHTYAFTAFGGAGELINGGVCSSYKVKSEKGLLSICYQPDEWVQTQIPAPLTDDGEALIFHNMGLYISDSLTAVATFDGGNFTVWRSFDKAQSWQQTVIPEISYSARALLGFYDEQHGWLVACDSPASGAEPHRIFTTQDGGESWQELFGDWDAVYNRTLSGASFIDADTAFLCYRYEDDSEPAVCRSTDGGQSWQKLTIPMPGYDNFNKTPLTVYSVEGVLTLPVLLSDKTSGETEKIAYLHSLNDGESWSVDSVPYLRHRNIGVE